MEDVPDSVKIAKCTANRISYYSYAHLFKPVIVRFLRDPVLRVEHFVRQSAAFTLLNDLCPLL